MTLYTKGERRYREASPSEILHEASEILAELGIAKHAAVLEGISLAARANNEYEALLEAKRDKSITMEQKKLDRAVQ